MADRSGARSREHDGVVLSRAAFRSGDLTDPEYLAARALSLQLSRAEGIDAALQRDNLDAIIAPSYSFASSPAAVSGYPEYLHPGWDHDP